MDYAHVEFQGTLRNDKRKAIVADYYSTNRTRLVWLLSDTLLLDYIVANKCFACDPTCRTKMSRGRNDACTHCVHCWHIVVTSCEGRPYKVTTHDIPSPSTLFCLVLLFIKPPRRHGREDDDCYWGLSTRRELASAKVRLRPQDLQQEMSPKARRGAIRCILVVQYGVYYYRTNRMSFIKWTMVHR